MKIKMPNNEQNKQKKQEEAKKTTIDFFKGLNGFELPINSPRVGKPNKEIVKPFEDDIFIKNFEKFLTEYQKTLKEKYPKDFYRIGFTQSQIRETLLPQTINDKYEPRNKRAKELKAKNKASWKFFSLNDDALLKHLLRLIIIGKVVCVKVGKSRTYLPTSFTKIKDYYQSKYHKEQIQTFVLSSKTKAQRLRETIKSVFPDLIE